MKKVKLDNNQNGKQEVSIEHYYNYKNIPMVRIKGSFYSGGFNMSKNKLKAIFDLQDQLTDFVAGKFDEEIKTLEDGVVLKP